MRFQNVLLKRSLMVTTFVILGGITAVTFNACGPSAFYAAGAGSDDALAGVTGEGCVADLERAYATTYFPLLSVSCNACHSDAQGSTDITTSFATFQSKGESLIDYQMTHPHEGNGVNLTSQLAQISPAWTAATDTYNSCLLSGGPAAPTPDPSGGVALQTIDKTAPNIAQTLTNQNAWQTLTWDLQTEVQGAQQLAATFSVQVRYALYSGAAVGFEFRAPTLTMKNSGLTVDVAGLDIYADDDWQSGVTTYNSVAISVTGTAATNLAPGFANALDTYATPSATTAFSFKFPSVILH